MVRTWEKGELRMLLSSKCKPGTRKSSVCVQPQGTTTDSLRIFFFFYPEEKTKHPERGKKTQSSNSGNEMPESQDWGNLQVCVFYAIYSHCFLPSLNLPGNFPLHQFLFVTDVTDTLSRSHCCWRLPVQPQPHSPQSSPLTHSSFRRDLVPSPFPPCLHDWDTVLHEQTGQ